MLFVLVPPIPVLALLFALETLVIDVPLVPRLQPATVNLVFPGIPVVVILMIRVVYASFPLSLLVTFMLILRSSHSKGAQWRQECS
jgi:hypothetical protein